jgi:hypothetical protein
MKKLTTAILMILAISSYAGSIDSTLNKISIPDSAKVTMTTVYNDAKAGIAGLASALKVGAEHVYVIMVKQQIVKSITGCVILLFIIIGWIALVRGFEYGADPKKGDWEEGLVPYCIFIGGGLFVITIIFILNIECLLTGFINPEYGAIKDILEFVKK